MIKNEDIDNAIAALRALAEDEREPERYRDDYRTSASVFELLKLSVRVEFCNWCPDPPRPDDRYHPDGGPEHRADLGPVTIANEAAPTVCIPYTDRALVPMLAVRKAVLEDHGLMAEAREVGEQMLAVGQWQRANLDKLTPYPGVIPVGMSEAATW